MSKLKWWNAPTFTFKVNDSVVYVKVWALLVVVFVVGLILG